MSPYPRHVARAVAAALALVLALALACASPSGAPEPGRATGRVVVEDAAGNRHPVRVEIARTERERAKGLMHRERLDPDAGMLFLFDETGRHTFWMKDTPLPLDLIFIDDTGRIVGVIERAEPRTTNPRDAGVPSRYVLEVNGGWAAARGVKRGDRVIFEDVPRF